MTIADQRITPEEIAAVKANNADLERVLLEWGASEVSALDVYSDIFRLGEKQIQSCSSGSRDFTGNALAYWKNQEEETGHYRILFDDNFSEFLPELQEADFCIVNGLSYYGRRNTLEAADRMFALIIDLDGVTGKLLNNFLFAAIQSADYYHYPIPNYIVLSGHGVHLYYVMEDPILLYPEIKISLKKLKYALIKKIWNRYTSNLEKPQVQGINQGFRVIGGKAKIPGVRARAFRLNDHPVTLSYLGQFVGEADRVDESKLWNKSKLTRAEAKKKYPEWYQAVIENGEKRDGGWICNRALYEWWKRKIMEPGTGATFGHRYYCIMILVVYGVKCGIDLDEVERDCMDLIGFMNSISPENEFTERDVRDALEIYDRRIKRFSVDAVNEYSGIRVEKNRRNGQKQRDHLEEIRMIRDLRMRRQGRKWTDNNGRPAGSGTKEAAVRAWRAAHPDGRKVDCIRGTGISKMTVYKYWDQL